MPTTSADPFAIGHSEPEPFGVTIPVAPRPETTPGTQLTLAAGPETADGLTLPVNLPERLSPSRLMDFHQCPRLFYYKTVVKLPTAANVPIAAGILTHKVIEDTFAVPRPDRTLEAALARVDDTWEQVQAARDFTAITADPESVKLILAKTRAAVTNWYRIEDPTGWDPEAVELRVAADLDGVAVHGVIDRLDHVADRWVISDIKTGKVPDSRYLAKTFLPMNIYAACLAESNDIEVSELRLIYTVNGSRDDLRRQTVDSQTIKATIEHVSKAWKKINQCSEQGWPTRRSPLCSWCDFQSECPAWNPQLASIPLLVDGSPVPR